MNKFTHLHVHTDYSLLDGLGKSEQYAKKAKEIGQTHLAITDHGNIDGFLNHQRACQANGIKPIFGCECYLVPNAKLNLKEEKRAHIVLLVKNQTGFNNLCKLITYSNTEGFYYKPRIDFDSLNKYCEGIIVLTGCVESPIRHDENGAVTELMNLQTEVYLEVMPHNLKEQKELNKSIWKIANIHNLPIVLTNDCHYVNDGDEKLQEVLLAIQTNKKWNDPSRWKFNLKGLYLKTVGEMTDAMTLNHGWCYDAIKDAIDNTNKVAKLCENFTLKRGKINLPKPPMPNVDQDDFLMGKVQKGIEKKIPNLSPRELFRYKKRVSEEIKAIQQMKFTRYFLIVEEIVQWCRVNDILVGPGRGSCGGSLVCYLLDITQVDPMKYGLLFWRFISPNRVDLPDIDLDFQDDKRYLIREHLEELYGKYNVASISTFLKMKGKMCTRDIGRIFEINGKEIENVSKEFDSGESPEHIFTETTVGQDFIARHKDEASYIVGLEGQTRGIGMHAAGLCIANEDLRKGTYGGLCRRKEGMIAINWDKDDAEYMGLMKLDVLGLSTLTVLKETLELIKNNAGREISLVDDIPLDDQLVFDFINEGKTTGCFQIGTYSMSTLIKDMTVSNFEDISDANALARPGPLHSGLTAEYIERKHGRSKTEYLCEAHKKITESTFGIIIYQEQVMLVMRDMAGFSWADSDAVRKIIAKKKDVELLRKFKRRFIAGCRKTSKVPSTESSKMFDDLEKFANYVFNKAHSIEYSLIGYWQAWMKYYYPAEFICASLNHCSDKNKQILIAEAYSMEIDIILPKINISLATKWRVDKKEKKLYMPFCEIKGIGEKSADEIEKIGNVSKRRKRFFIQNVEKRKVNSSTQEVLTQINAFSSENLKGDALQDFAKSFLGYKLKANPTNEREDIINYITQNHVGELPNWKDFSTTQLVEGDFPTNLRLAKKIKIRLPVTPCADCPLDRESQYIKTSRGIYNMLVLGEAPNKDDMQTGKPVSGGTNKVLWRTLSSVGLNRKHFFVSNIVKCFPGQPSILRETPEVSEHCFKILKEEIKNIKPFIIFASGNTAMRFFKGEEKGIMSMSGKIEWSNEFSCWVCYCIHPASAFFEDSKKMQIEYSVSNFLNRIIKLGGFEQ